MPGRPAAQELARRLLDAGLAHPDPASGPPGPGPDEVTAVIPVRDRPAELARCLAGLDGMRVIVVDDGSADPPPWRRPPRPRARSACAGTGAGAAGAARNTGLAAVRTPLVAFVDSDCVPRPGWLTPLLRHFADPAVGAVAPRISGP